MQTGKQNASTHLWREVEITKGKWLKIYSPASVFQTAERDFVRVTYYRACSLLLLNRLLSRWLTNTEKMKCWSFTDTHCHHPLLRPFFMTSTSLKVIHNKPSSSLFWKSYQLGDEHSIGDIIHLGFIKVSLPNDSHSAAY